VQRGCDLLIFRLRQSKTRFAVISANITLLETQVAHCAIHHLDEEGFVALIKAAQPLVFTNYDP
jgi:hypothetical protein